jgi:uncharacterized protein YbaR (Trm112 family)
MCCWYILPIIIFPLSLRGYYLLNLLINNNECPICHNKVLNGVVSDYFTFDKSHDELYCNKCGLIVRTNDLPRIADLEYMVALPIVPEPQRQYEVSPVYTALTDFLNEIEEKKRLKKLKAKARAKQKRRSKK